MALDYGYYAGLGQSAGPSSGTQMGEVAKYGAGIIGVLGEGAEFWTKYADASGKEAPPAVEAFRDMYSPRAAIEKGLAKAEGATRWLLIGGFVLAALWVLKRR
jgi:hypothetical protein